MGRLAEIQLRLAAISQEVKAEGADLEALKAETEALVSERKQLMDAAETRSNLLRTIAENRDGQAVTVRTFEETRKPEQTFSEDLKTRAFLKGLLNEELNAEERAYIHTTENTDAVVAPQLIDKIFSQMEEKHPILRDVNVLRSGAVISIVKHTAIVAGDAKAVAEGVANDDEQNTFVKVDLVGKDFSKHVDFSYRLGKMSIPAFEQYLVKEIGDRLGSVMADDIVAQIKADMAAANKITGATAGVFAAADYLKALAALKQVGRVNVYVNNATFYGLIAAMENTNQTLNFLVNYQDDIAGTLVGKAVKEEDAVADNEILVLDPQQFIYNIVQDPLIERDRDIKNHVHTISGFAIAGGSLTNDKAAALVTITAAP